MPTKLLNREEIKALERTDTKIIKRLNRTKDQKGKEGEVKRACPFCGKTWIGAPFPLRRHAYSGMEITNHGKKTLTNGRRHFRFGRVQQ